MNKQLLRHTYSFYFILGCIAAILFVPLSASASQLSLKVPTTVSEGDRVSVDVFVDPQQVSINSVASTILFSPEHVSFNGFSAQQSSIPVWVEEPKEKIAGEVSFSGVIPGGLDRLYDPLNVNNKAIPVVRLFFIAKKSGTVTFSFGPSSVLANDGRGTKTSVTTSSANTTIVAPATVGHTTTALESDTTSPVPFVITVVNRSLFGKTPRLAVFTANDKEGGIDHYEVRVGNLNFVRGTSPFPLPYRLFSYDLTVRAFDYSGNMQEQTVTIPAENATMVDGTLVVVCLILLGFFVVRFYNRRKT